MARFTHTHECTFFTLPLVDGYLWSKKEELAGLRLKAFIDSKEVLLEGKEPVFTNIGEKAVHISWPLVSVRDTLEIDLDEKTLRMKLVGNQPCSWYLELNTAVSSGLPFDKVAPGQVDCSFEGMQYQLKAIKGAFSKPGKGAVFKITLQQNVIALDLANTGPHQEENY